MEPKVEVVDSIPMAKGGPGRAGRKDIDQWLASVPPKGLPLRITFETKKEAQGVYQALFHRRQKGKVNGIGFAIRGLSLFLWRTEG